MSDHQRILEMIIKRREMLFEEAARLKADPIITSEEEERERLAKLRTEMLARLATHGPELDRVIAEAMSNPQKTRLQLFRIEGASWREDGKGTKRGRGILKKRGKPKIERTFDKLGVTRKSYGLGLILLDEDKIEVFKEWVEASYWSGVWCEHRNNVDARHPYQEGIHSKVTVSESLVLEWQ